MNTDGVRLDQWLWAARFYKTRALAVTAIRQGRVLVGGQRAKPARKIALRDVLIIQKTADLRFEVVVQALETRRASAKLAAAFYEETAASLEQRAMMAEKQKLARDLVAFPHQRPDKRERRKLRELRHQQEN